MSPNQNSDTEKFLIDKLVTLQERHLEALSLIQREAAKEKDVSAILRMLELHLKDFSTLVEMVKERDKAFVELSSSISEGAKKREKDFDDAIKEIKDRDESLRKFFLIVGSIQTSMQGLVALLIILLK